MGLRMLNHSWRKSLEHGNERERIVRGGVWKKKPNTITKICFGLISTSRNTRISSLSPFHDSFVTGLFFFLYCTIREDALKQTQNTTAKKQQSWSYWCGAVALLLASIPGQYIVIFSSYTSWYDPSLITVCAVIIPRIRYDTGIHIVRIKNMLNVIDAPKTNATLTLKNCVSILRLM